MRLLHTSDWHLGRSFHGRSLLDEQEAALARIVEVAVTGEAGAVVVAGDLFDRAVPPAEAVELFSATVAELHGAGIEVIAIAGNHDSAVRVGAHQHLLERVGVSVRGGVGRVGEPVVLDGDAERPLVVYPVPYLDPVVAGPELLTDAEREEAAEVRRVRLSHHAVLRRALERVRADLAGRGAVRSVVVAHTFVTGAMAGGSERDIAVGGVELADASLFAGIDYVALGHLHRPQEVGGRPEVAYSGTPLPYSFGEEGDVKSVRLVDVTGHGVVVEEVPLGVGTPLRTIRGRIDDLVSDPALADAEGCRVRAVLTDPVPPTQAKARLEARFTEVLELAFEPTRADGESAPLARAAEVRTRSPLELTEAFATELFGELTDAQRSLLADAVRAASRAGDPGADRSKAEVSPEVAA